MVDFKTLRKSSSDLDRLNNEIQKLTQTRQSDERYWTTDPDKAGNAAAVIRFLPGAAVDGDDAMPFVRYFKHSFKGPTGQWYIENCLSTMNKPDPVMEYNSKLWNSSEDDKSLEREQARKQKRTLKYVSNILVVSDPKHPENEGKIFLFAYGKKIFDKIKRVMNPDADAAALGDKPVNPFNLWEGVNFRLRQRKGDGGFPNYDDSRFDETPVPVGKSDDEREEIWKKEHSLKAVVAPDQFKPYAELKARLNTVLGIDTGHLTENTSISTVTDKTEAVVADTTTTDSVDDSGEDGDLEYFKNLAAD